MTATETDGVAAVDRALAAATALAGHGPSTLTELSRLTGFYKSTLLRLLASLERAGLVVHQADRKYALGPLAFVFGRAFEQANGLQQTLMPVMQALVDQDTESPSFHVRHGDDSRLCLLRIDSHHSTLDRVRAGESLPLRRGAPGKVLQLFADGAPEVATGPLVFTSFGERDPLCGAIAAPVFGPGNTLLGALSLSGPLDRFGEAEVERMGRLLAKAAGRATASLGGRWPAVAG